MLVWVPRALNFRCQGRGKVGVDRSLEGAILKVFSSAKGSGREDKHVASIPQWFGCSLASEACSDCNFHYCYTGFSLLAEFASRSA